MTTVDALIVSSIGWVALVVVIGLVLLVRDAVCSELERRRSGPRKLPTARVLP